MDTDHDSEQQPLIQEFEAKKESNSSPITGCFRYTGLFFLCLITFGPYFSYVLPGALETEIERDMRVTTTEFTLFTSLYSWPNIFICFFSGYLIDKVLGIRLGGIIFSSLITLGMSIFAFGAYIDQVIVMDVGRFIFGMGGESVAIAQKAYSVKWFSKKELNLVFGLLVVGALSGAALNQMIMDPIYEFILQYETGYKALGMTIFIGSSTCAFSTICTLVTAYMDTSRDRQLRKIKKKDTSGVKEEPKKINLKDALYFPLELWLIFIMACVSYSAVFPFISLGKLYFIRKYQFSATVSALQQSLFFIVTTVLSPLFGIIVDKTGHNTLWVVVSCAVALASHAVMLFTFVNSFIPVITLAASLALLATALWPMVSELVPQHQLSTAYGLMQSIQNLGLASFSVLSGVIVENYGYTILELFFLSLCIISFAASITLYFVDKSKNGPLGRSASENRASEMNSTD